jgi:hypothetical protein
VYTYVSGGFRRSSKVYRSLVIQCATGDVSISWLKDYLVK